MLIFISSFLILGCTQGETKYVCENGSVVSNPEECSGKPDVSGDEQIPAIVMGGYDIISSQGIPVECNFTYLSDEPEAFANGSFLMRGEKNFLTVYEFEEGRQTRIEIVVPGDGFEYWRVEFPYPPEDSEPTTTSLMSELSGCDSFKVERNESGSTYINHIRDSNMVKISCIESEIDDKIFDLEDWNPCTPEEYQEEVLKTMNISEEEWYGEAGSTD